MSEGETPASPDDNAPGPSTSVTQHHKKQKATAVGSIIGIRGELITQIQSETGVILKLSKPNDLYPGTNERVCLIQGSLDGVTRMHDYLMDRLIEQAAFVSGGRQPTTTIATTSSADHPSSSSQRDESAVARGTATEQPTSTSSSSYHHPTTGTVWTGGQSAPSSSAIVVRGRWFWERHHQVKILVPNCTAGLVIGKNGNYIEEIKDRTGAFIQVSQKADDVNLVERSITLAGKPEQCRAAVAMVLAKIAEDPQSGSCPNISYSQFQTPIASAYPTGSPFAVLQSDPHHHQLFGSGQPLFYQHQHHQRPRVPSVYQHHQLPQQTYLQHQRSLLFGGPTGIHHQGHQQGHHHQQQLSLYPLTADALMRALAASSSTGGSSSSQGIGQSHHQQQQGNNPPHQLYHQHQQQYRQQQSASSGGHSGGAHSIIPVPAAMNYQTAALANVLYHHYQQQTDSSGRIDNRLWSSSGDNSNQQQMIHHQQQKMSTAEMTSGEGLVAQALNVGYYPAAAYPPFLAAAAQQQYSQYTAAPQSAHHTQQALSSYQQQQPASQHPHPSTFQQQYQHQQRANIIAQQRQTDQPTQFQTRTHQVPQSSPHLPLFASSEVTPTGDSPIKSVHGDDQTTTTPSSTSEPGTSTDPTELLTPGVEGLYIARSTSALSTTTSTLVSSSTAFSTTATSSSDKASHSAEDQHKQRINGSTIAITRADETDSRNDSSQESSMVLTARTSRAKHDSSSNGSTASDNNGLVH